MLEKGSLKPLIDRKYPLSGVSKAYEYMMTGEKVGSVLLEITQHK